MGIVLRQSFKATIFSYIGAVIGVLNIVLVSPYCLSPEVIGLNRMFCESAMFLVFFVQLAVPQTAIKFFPYFKKDSDNSNRGFFAFFLIIPIIGLIIFGIIYIILKPLIINYFITNSKIFTSYFYYIIPFTVILSYLNVVETFATCLYRIVIPKMIREIIIRILNILIIFLFYFKLLSLNQFIISLIGIYFTGFLLNLFYLRKFLRISFKINFKWIDKNLVKQIIYYTIFIILGGIGSAIAGKIDVFMISSKLGISQTGIFTIAFYMIAIIEIPSRALMQISAPIVSEAIKNNDIKNIESIYKKSSINQLIVGGGLFILLWININNIFRIMPHGNLYECGRYV
ncbi:MAG: hypothetical protein Q8880_10450, partial [Bacteroidota bacterium]|nr:hypothetical protein [Bacteroidota bacterium]